MTFVRGINNFFFCVSLTGGMSLLRGPFPVLSAIAAFKAKGDEWILSLTHAESRLIIAYGKPDGSLERRACWFQLLGGL